MRETILLFTNYSKKFEKLSDEQFGKLMRAVLEYQETEENPIIEDITVSVAFDVVKADIDRNNAKFEEICEKRREAGKKGGLAKASNAKQKLANGSNAKQELAKPTLYENEYENEYENNNIVNKSNSLHSLDCINSSETSSDMPAQTEPKEQTEDEKYAVLVKDLRERAEDGKVDEIIHEYERVCTELPGIKKINKQRRAKVKARLKTFSVAEIYQAFAYAAASDFLCGRSTEWKASFDWFFANDSNIQKVLEGNYANKSPTKKGNIQFQDQRSYDFKELEKALINKSG
jgi:hypothetical protein